MSDHDEVMEQLRWCVTALKYLLQQTVGYEPEGLLEDYQNDEPEPPPVVAAPLPVQQVCTHPNQVNDRGTIKCAACGHVLITGTGIGGPASIVP